MNASRYLAILLLLSACSWFTKSDPSPFEGQWSGSWNPLGTMDPAPLQISINDDGSGTGSGEITWIDPDDGTTVTETIELIMEVDEEGRVSGNGTWSMHVSGAGNLDMASGALTGHFERDAGSGRFPVCPPGSG